MERIIYLQLQSEMLKDLKDNIYIIYVTSKITDTKLSSLQDHALTIGTIVLYCMFTVLFIYCTTPCMYCSVLCTLLYCTVLYCTVLYCTVLYFTMHVLYCPVLELNYVLCCTVPCIHCTVLYGYFTVLCV